MPTLLNSGGASGGGVARIKRYEVLTNTTTGFISNTYAGAIVPIDGFTPDKTEVRVHWAKPDMGGANKDTFKSVYWEKVFSFDVAADGNSLSVKCVPAGAGTGDIALYVKEGVTGSVYLGGVSMIILEVIEYA